jgi:hypothetical protein
VGIVGYTYDADQHCVDCTHKRFPVLDESTRDSEGNEIHPIFDTNEAGNSPSHCGEWGVLIEDSWTGETVEYVTSAISEYMDNYLSCQDSYNNPVTMDIWAAHQSNCVIDLSDERVLKVYEFIRKEEKGE